MEGLLSTGSTLSSFYLTPLPFSDVLELEVYKKGDYVVREVGVHTVGCAVP